MLKMLTHVAAVFAAVLLVAPPSAQADAHTPDHRVAWQYCHCNPGPLPPGTGSPVPPCKIKYKEGVKYAHVYRPVA